jgi:hypothetical protein
VTSSFVASASRASEKLGLAADEEPTNEQLEAAEQESMAEALQPFHNPKLRETILGINASPILEAPLAPKRSRASRKCVPKRELGNERLKFAALATREAQTTVTSQ